MFVCVSTCLSAICCFLVCRCLSVVLASMLSLIAVGCMLVAVWIWEFVGRCLLFGVVVCSCGAGSVGVCYWLCVVWCCSSVVFRSVLIGLRSLSSLCVCCWLSVYDLSWSSVVCCLLCVGVGLCSLFVVGVLIVVCCVSCDGCVGVCRCLLFVDR